MIERARLDIRKFFFSNRVTQPWNNLPIEIREAESVNEFKIFYDDYIREQPDIEMIH